MLRLPQFSIAQLLGFTFVCAIDVWAFLWEPCAGFWVTLVTQVVFWTILRVRAALRTDRQLKRPPNSRRPWFWGVVAISAVNSVGAVVTFLVITLLQGGISSFFFGPDSDIVFPILVFGVFLPVGILAGAMCLWWTWPRR